MVPPGNPSTEETLGECRVFDDGRGRTMPYVVRPAENPTASRTLVILHGRGRNKAFAKFASPAWNVICPLDLYGHEGKGSWWLGEGGETFTLEMLHGLVERTRAEIGGD